MKSKLKKLEGTLRQFHIEIPKEKVDQVFNEVLAGIQRTAVIPGFRQGKAPIDIVRKSHQETAMDEVKQRLIPEGYQSALMEHKVRPVSYPEVTDVNMGLAGSLTFMAKVDAHPEINLRKYKALKVTSEKVSVKDEEVESALDRIKNMNAEFTDIDSPLKKGDYGICDVQTFMDGEEISKKRENMWIEVDKEASMLGLGEKLEGLKKGEAKDIEAELPKEYPDEKYAGKKATFRIEIKEAKEKKLPELNDELAKKVGKGTVEEMRQEISKQLAERKEANVKTAMKNQIMEQLLAEHSFDLPGTMVERQLKVLMEKAENELTSKGVDKETIESHKETLKEKLQKEAEAKVKLYFILDAIANIEEIAADDSEVDEWLKSLATSYNQPFDKVKEYYQQHDLIGGLKEQLREEKTLDFLLSEANVKGK